MSTNNRFDKSKLPTHHVSIGEELSEIRREADGVVIYAATTPITRTGGVVGLKGNLAPDGAIVKVAGMTSEEQVFIGLARVFDCEEDAFAAVKVRWAALDMGQSRILAQGRNVMSTWISKATAFGIAVVLTGCLDAETSLRKRPVLDGAFIVAAPRGYCIDPAGVREGDDAALALVGRCASGTAAPAILTVAAGPAGSARGLIGAQAAMAAYFVSDEGRAALSRTGDGATVTVDEVVVQGGAVLLRLRDTSPNPQAPGQIKSWRSVLPIANRLVSLTVTAAGEDGLSTTQGQALLTAFVDALRRANGAADV